MNSIYKTLVLRVLFVFLISNTFVFAQYDERDRHPYSFNGPGAPPGDPDPEPAPIDDYLLIMAVVGVGLAYYVIKKTKQTTE